MARHKAWMLAFVAPLALWPVLARAEASSAACDKVASVVLPNTAVKATYVTSQAQIDAAFASPDSRAGSTAPSATLPLCRIEVTITPAPGAEIKSEFWLPPAEKWNGRFLSIGAGGSAGFIDRRALASGSAQGYAVSTSDAGSHSPVLLSMTFGRNKEWRENFAHRGVHLTAVTGKALVQAFYQAAPKASLFMGCSGGGYEAMSLVNHHPDDYDGVIAGDPALNWEKQSLWQGSVYNATSAPGAQIPRAKLAGLNRALVAQCDALDGVKDGVLDDPRKCKPDFKALQCKAGDGDDCMTAPQVAALEKIYAPFHHPRTGELLFPGFTIGAENMPAARSRLAGEPDGSTVTVHQPGPLVWFTDNFTAKDWANFDFDKGTDKAIKDFAPYANSNPDLKAFKGSGGKFIMYTGWADPNLNPENMVNYYEKLKKVMGAGEAQDFSRVFLAPGMGHCSGGPGPNVFGQDISGSLGRQNDAGNNILLALDRWIVDGVAPERIVATKYVDNDRAKGVERTRPLCAYPKVARWSGKGSTDDAANFNCVSP